MSWNIKFIIMIIAVLITVIFTMSTSIRERLWTIKNEKIREIAVALPLILSFSLIVLVILF